MTNGQIIACLFIVCGGAIGGAAAYCLHMRLIMRDILRDEKERLRIWARNHAEMIAQEQLVDMLRHLRVTGATERRKHMTPNMKRWLHEHGLTAVQVAQKTGLLIPDMYRQLSGTMPVNPALRDTLCGVYGMTQREFREAMP